MRLFTFCVVLSAAAWAQQAPKTARIIGRVVDQRGDPVRRATVKLYGKDTYTQTSGDNGEFSLDNIAPGTYALAAQRTGYSGQKYGATTPLIRDCASGDSLAETNLNPIQTSMLQQCVSRAPGTLFSLATGQEMKDLTIRLMQQGSISGRLTNQDGEPVPKWQVQAMKVVYQGGRRQLQAGFGARTDDDGTFSAGNLTPGQYYLHAVDLTSNMFAGLSRDRQPKPTPEADVATYYPSEADEARAVPVEVTPGAESRGIDIRLQRAKVYSVRGKVAAPADGGPPEDQILSISVKGAPSTIVNTKQTSVRPDGTFEFRGLQPGEYVLSSGQVQNGNPGAAPTLFSQRNVVVSDSDVEAVDLPMGPGIDLAGTISMEGGKPPRWPFLTLTQWESGGGAGGVDPNSSGVFAFPRKIAPSKYVVGFPRGIEGMYVKSISYGGQDAIHAPLDLTSRSGGSLDIVLSGKVATATGRAKSASGDAAVGVVISVWPRLPEVAGGVKSASTDQDGRFEISDLGPGSYWVAAWEDIDPGLLQDPTFLSRFQTDASVISLEEGGRTSTDVKIIPGARVAAEVAKLR